MKCVLCGKEVEKQREVYVHPTCYECLPPPEPLPECGVTLPYPKVEFRGTVRYPEICKRDRGE